jgi:hypothetical protein
VWQTLVDAARIYLRLWKFLLAASVVVNVAAGLVSGLALTIVLPRMSGVGDSVLFDGEQRFQFAQMIANLITVIPVSVLMFAVFGIVIDDARRARQGVPVGDVLSRVMRRLPAAFGTALLMWAGIVGGYVLLVIPALVLAVMWCMAIPASVLEDKAGAEALGRSRQLTKGNRWRLLGLFLLAGIPGGIVVTIIGVVLVSNGPWLSSSLYEFMMLRYWLPNILFAPYGGCVAVLAYFALRGEPVTIPAASRAPRATQTPTSAPVRLPASAPAAAAGAATTTAAIDAPEPEAADEQRVQAPQTPGATSDAPPVEPAAAEHAAALDSPPPAVPHHEPSHATGWRARQLTLNVPMGQALAYAGTFMAGVLAAVVVGALVGDDAPETVEKVKTVTVAEPSSEPSDFQINEDQLPGFYDTRGSKMDTDLGRCTADLTFVWNADDPSRVEDGSVAKILFVGPDGGNVYEQTVVDGVIKLEVTDKVYRGQSSYRAELLSIDDRDADAAEIPFTNTATVCE